MNKEMKIVTNVGLNLPDDCTEHQFFEVGKLLADIESGHQWALGDWYNKIPNGKGNQYSTDEGKKAACEKAGLTFNTARQDGLIAKIFASDDRSSTASFKHHIIVSSLPEDQRMDLLKQAEENKWSAAELTKAKKKLLGIEPPIKPADFDEHMQAMLDAIPAGAKREVKGKVKAMATYLRKEFESSVKKAVQAKVNDEQLRLKDRSRELKERDRRIKNMMKNVTGVMSEKDFKVVLGCLHPDRECAPDRKAKAFEIFNRLKDGVNWK